MSNYVRPDGLTARTDKHTTCRCGQPDCQWTEADDKQRDLAEWTDKYGPTLYPDMYPDMPATHTTAEAWAARP